MKISMDFLSANVIVDGIKQEGYPNNEGNYDLLNFSKFFKIRKIQIKKGKFSKRLSVFDENLINKKVFLLSYEGAWSCP